MNASNEVSDAKTERVTENAGDNALLCIQFSYRLPISICFHYPSLPSFEDQMASPIRVISNILFLFLESNFTGANFIAFHLLPFSQRYPSVTAYELQKVFSWFALKSKATSNILPFPCVENHISVTTFGILHNSKNFQFLDQEFRIFGPDLAVLWNSRISKRALNLYGNRNFMVICFY